MPKPLRLLLVEDSSDDVLLVTRFLQRAGFALDLQVVETEEAYRAALAGEAPEVIVSDFSLPAFDGLRALAVLNESGLDIPFVVVSGTIGEETAVAAMKAGASDYIMKGRLQRLAPAIERELREAERRAEHRRAELDREQLRAQLFQLQKMEALGSFAGGIAHDFNNLLTVLGMNVDLALQALEAGDAGAGAELLQEMKKANDRAASLVRQLLLFSRRSSVDFASLDVNALVRGVASMLTRLVGDGIELRLVEEPSPWLFQGDVSSLEHVIVNLVTNARDAMPRGGVIEIRTRNRLLSEPSQARPGTHAGPHVVISVKDDGTGIPPEIMDQIFDPFFTTKPAGHGTGLGLSTTYNLVWQHGGWVEVESGPGRGTTFSVVIPAT